MATPTKTAKPSPSAGKTAAKSSGKAAAGKAAATVAAGGGPEDPITDVLAAKNFVSSSGGTKELKTGQTPSLPKAKGKLTGSNTNRLLLTEFLVCFMVLGFGTIVPTPKDRKNEGVGHLVVKGSALALLFFILSLVASGGPKANKAASGLGGLVTAAYLFTSEDAYNILAWISGFYGKKGNVSSTDFSTVAYSGKFDTAPSTTFTGVQSETSTAQVAQPPSSTDVYA